MQHALLITCIGLPASPHNLQVCAARLAAMQVILIRIIILRGNSLQGPQTNHASFYGPAKLQLPYLTLISFSFPSMALPLHLQLTPS